MAHAKSKSPTKKPKLIRDSFSIPKTEYAAIDALKTRAVSLGTTVKKSELLRAGLMALQGMNEAAYKRALAAVPKLKAGRPAAADSADQLAVPHTAIPQRPVRKVAAKTSAKTTAKVPTKAARAPAQARAKRPTVKKTLAKA